MENHEEQYHSVSYGTYVLVWLGLLVFTGLTVTVSGMNLGKLSLIIPLIIASLKGGLVLYFFMHFKYEKRLLKFMLFIVLIIVVIFITFPFFDISFR